MEGLIISEGAYNRNIKGASKQAIKNSSADQNTFYIDCFLIKL